MSSHERDPKKRRVKPVEPAEQTNILDFDEESSDDSDFRIEDHPEISDEDDSLDSQGEGKIDDSSDSNEDESEDSDEDVIKTLGSPKTNGMGLNMSDVILQAANHSKLKFNETDAQITICCGCLGDHSDGVNEIVECDGCGATVHEACYGVSDSNSLASTDSVSPTTPWFCESCKAGIREPVCELCPNAGGIFKETDVGKWVHLVCALYVPGVAFGEVDKLTSVTLFEMPYNKWGSKVCSLCDDERFARTGVCIGCDAGMCRTYFHVTCAQKEGFLSEAHSEEVDQADPFYAHCKLHSDKTLVKRRKRNYMALQLRTQYRKYQFSQEGHKNTPEQLRITRKLEKQKVHYLSHKSLKPPPWVPTQKMPRLLTTSASACRKLFRKAELMGINTLALEMQESQITALADIRKKWHIPPAFSVEFIAYYLDRNDRLKDMKTALERYLEENKVLLEEQQQLRTKYDEVLKKSTDVSTTNSELKQSIHKFHSAILSACPTKNLPNIDDLGKPFTGRMPQPMMVPTAAALKMGVGFPLKNIPSGRADRVLSSHANKDPLLLNECGTCGQRRDQHLLAKCDTCHLYYHLDCLNPPLSRLPKKSKLYGWQCSECDKTSDSEVEEMKTPRRSRSIYSNRESKSDQDFTGTTPPKLKIKPVDTSVEKPLSEKQPSKVFTNLISELSETNGIQIVVDNGYEASHKSGKKRRREKHRSRNLDSPDVSREHKRKRKKKSLDIEEPLPHPRITIKRLSSKTRTQQTLFNLPCKYFRPNSKRSRKSHTKHKNPLKYMKKPQKIHPKLKDPTNIQQTLEDFQNLRLSPFLLIKPIPLPAGEVASESNPQCFYVPNEADDNAPPPLLTLKPAKIDKRDIRKSRNSTTSVLPPPNFPDKPRRSLGGGSPKKVAACGSNVCDVCHEPGTPADSVKCDECQKNYHFTCLDPPVKKTPKIRGYSWHCADCDPTGSE